MFRRELAAQADNFPPRPLPEAVFILEGGPRRDKGRDAHARPQAALQIERVGLGEQGDVEAFRGGAQQWRGDHQVAQAPQFHDEQFGFQGVRVPRFLCGKLLSLKSRTQPRPRRRAFRSPGGCRGGLPRRAADAAIQADAQPKKAGETRNIGGEPPKMKKKTMVFATNAVRRKMLMVCNAGSP